MSQEKLDPVHLQAPYLIYFGDVTELGYAKTGLGLIHWRKELCAGQFRLPGCGVDGGIAEMSIDAAQAAGVRSVIVGVAPTGGALPASWVKDLAEAARRGMDIVSGLHVRLSEFSELAAAVAESGAQLIDIRIPPRRIGVATGEKRNGRRVLAVGTDCAVGKKYTALAIEREMRSRGWSADFRATGQTGIMIAGSGVPIDSVIGDFISGAAELVSPAAADDHWDVIEGQGALSHPSYAGVSLGLLHGSQPDALVLCHDASRTRVLGLGSDQIYPLLSLNETIRGNLEAAHRVNPLARFVGVSVNSSGLETSERSGMLSRYEEETGLPAVDPIIDGPGRIVDRIEQEFEFH